MIDQYLDQLVKTPSDINEHLLTLKSYGEKCQRITEMGFRTGFSFAAFLSARPQKLVTYDLFIPEDKKNMFMEMKGDTEISFKEENTLETVIDECDLLFIDTLHTYSQLKAELNLHASKAKKYLGFHDTFTYGHVSENGETKGLKDAINEFLLEHPEWEVVEEKTNNNGLLIMERK